MVRHGQSEWNKENRFTGWYDSPLSVKGVEEAIHAGKLLREKGFSFDLAFTSVLKRAIKTLWCIQEELDQTWIPVEKAWQLNERHYGNLQGLNKKETSEKYGEEQVHIWRRSYATPPPLMDETDERHPKYLPQYKNLDPSLLPSGESLKLTLERVQPYWDSNIAPLVKEGKSIIIAAHGNSIRSLVKLLAQISDEEITKEEIPTGSPLVFELNKDSLLAEKYYYLDDPEKVKQQQEAVAQQAKN